MVIVRPSPAACSPLLRSRSTGPQPLAAEVQDRSLSSRVPAAGRSRQAVVALAVSVASAGMPSPAACSPLLRSRSTRPEPLIAEVQGRSLSWLMAVGGGTGLPGVTRYITVAWAGTETLMVPVVEPVCLDHSSLSVYEDAPLMPS